MSLKIAALTNAAPTGPWYPVGPGAYSVAVKGEFDEGTVVIEASDDAGATALAAGDDEGFTANGFKTLEVGQNMQLRAKITGQGATANITVTVHPLR